METEGYLIDTNAGIDYLANVMPESGLLLLDNIIDHEYSISVISRIELYSYSKLNEAEKDSLDIFTSQSTILNINDEIIEKTIELRKAYRTKLPDAIIAATVLVYNLTLVTRNISDFRNISGIKLLDPYNI